MIDDLEPAPLSWREYRNRQRVERWRAKRGSKMQYDEEEARYLAAQDRAKRQHRRSLERHPDCRDPDHPGCEFCVEDDENEDESE